jgi:23S rRNA (cytosine1962-C5)-methyltransferase
MEKDLSNRIVSQPWADYELIDAGGGKKLERWGKVITIRPEIQAYFKSEIPFTEWEKMANWEFRAKAGNSGTWKALKPNSPKQWSITYKQLQFQLELTKFKHVGLFPEQRSNWDLIRHRLNSEDKFLNLFAYTGAASCVARYAGAETYHVDSVKQLISWARTNMEESRLLNIKWVLEDALKFANREVKRGNTYKGIIMDTHSKCSHNTKAAPCAVVERSFAVRVAESACRDRLKVIVGTSTVRANFTPTGSSTFSTTPCNPRCVNKRSLAAS